MGVYKIFEKVEPITTMGGKPVGGKLVSPIMVGWRKVEYGLVVIGKIQSCTRSMEVTWRVTDAWLL